MDTGNTSKSRRREGNTAFNSWRRIVSMMEDRLSPLTNDILGLILSKIPIREAVRCSILSRRWRYAYTHIRELQFSPSLLLDPRVHDLSGVCTKPVWVEFAISRILRLHSSHVEAFRLSGWRFTAENVSRWVQYAASKNVERISLLQCSQIKIPPAAIFTCARLTTLELSDYDLSNIPDSCVRFDHLLSCSFDNVQLTDDSLALFISRCPLLQRLSLNPSDGLLNPVIAAPNIEYLVIYHDIEMKDLIIACPKLLTLKTEARKLLRVNGVFFHEISGDSRSLKMEMESTSSLVELCLDTSSLVELSLNLDEDEYGETPNISAARFLDSVSNFKSLKKLCINTGDDSERKNEEMTVSFLKLLGMLPNLEVLYMGRFFASELDEDRIPECLSSPLANLRKVRVELWSFSETETAVLGCLLQSSPALEVLKFRLVRWEDIETPKYMAFMENLSSLKRASTQATIRPAERISLQSYLMFQYLRKSSLPSLC